MDFRLLLRQISVEHGAEDGASHGEDVLSVGEEETVRTHKVLFLAERNEEAGTMLLEVFRKHGVTLCAGTLCEAPRGPTMKWTSAISSLLNIKAFLKEEHNKPLCPPTLVSL